MAMAARRLPGIFVFGRQLEQCVAKARIQSRRRAEMLRRFLQFRLPDQTAGNAQFGASRFHIRLRRRAVMTFRLGEVRRFK